LLIGRCRRVLRTIAAQNGHTNIDCYIHRLATSDARVLDRSGPHFGHACGEGMSETALAVIREHHRA
jgi:hypothetical protein